MAVNSKHPLYKGLEDAWIQLADCYAGEAQIKDGGTDYLPATMGMEADGMTEGQDGAKAYEAYKARAVFQGHVEKAVNDLVGLMHRKPAKIELPARLEEMMKAATPDGETPQALLRKINFHQLLFGRCGLLIDPPDGKDAATALPRVAFYSASRIINWDSSGEGDFAEDNIGDKDLQLVVLDESRAVRNQGFEWIWRPTWRVCAAGDIAAGFGAETEGPETALQSYQVALVDQEETHLPTAEDFVVPSIAGKELDKVPFFFINAVDTIPDPSKPPLLALSNLDLAIYRGEADYRQNLFMQSQETLVISGRTNGGEEGEGDETRTGAGAVLDLPMNAKAEYVGVSGTGLEQQAKAIEKDADRAAHMGGSLLQNVEGDTASGTALNVRVAAQTASLSHIARAGADGLRSALRMCAEWVGANPDEVVVEPNLDFAQEGLEGQDALYWMQAKALGFPVSLKSLHGIARSKDVTQMDFEEETALIEEENAQLQLASPDANPQPDPNAPPAKPGQKPAPAKK